MKEKRKMLLTHERVTILKQAAHMGLECFAPTMILSDFYLISDRCHLEKNRLEWGQWVVMVSHVTAAHQYVG